MRMGTKLHPYRDLMGQGLDSYRIGLFIPMCRDAGIWGVSCRACAELAADEINNQGGIEGREIQLIIEGACSGEQSDIAETAELMVEEGQIDAIVGMHTSDVRARIEQINLHDIPYVYTSLWEGVGEDPSTICIGEIPQQQLVPSMEWLIDRYNLQTWVFVGHDYAWPRLTHTLANNVLSKNNKRNLCEIYLPFEISDFSSVLGRIEELKPDAVLVSLIGQGNVDFNKQFAQAGLDQSVLRLSTAVEENMLLSIGEQNTSGLFVSSGYFSHIQTKPNGDFLERYHNFHGDMAPPIGTVGHSLYEGVYLLRDHILSSDQHDFTNPEPIPFSGARQGNYFSNNTTNIDHVFLMEATGIDFKTTQRFDMQD